MAHYYIHKIELMDPNHVDVRDMMKWMKFNPNHNQIWGAAVRYKIHRIMGDPNIRLEAV